MSEVGAGVALLLGTGARVGGTGTDSGTSAGVGETGSFGSQITTH